MRTRKHVRRPAPRKRARPGAPVTSPETGAGQRLATNKEKTVRLEGMVKETLPNAQFRVDLDGGHEVLAHVSGKMRMRFIRITAGDRVTVELSPYDLTRGRITWLHR